MLNIFAKLDDASFNEKEILSDANLYKLNASKNALLAFVLNEKHETIVQISRQYLFGTDKAVQISRTACCDKGTQAQYFKQKSKITLLIRTSYLNIAWLFWFQTF